ncbi:MAG: Zn-dependent alcohol dehydrogenase, partial [Bacteroidota bacterium]
SGTGSFTIESVTVADPQAGEVLVDMKAAGLCHPDHDSLSWGKPIVMGHEGAGVVAKVGAGITDLEPGDRVILNWATPCRKCFQCTRGNEHICEQNSPVVAGGNGYTPGHAHLEGTKWRDAPLERSFNLGTLAEYTLVQASAVVKIADTDIPFPSASIISCGVMTGFGSVVNSARFAAGSSAVVLGTGGVGLNVIQGLKVAGAGRIIAVDINPERLEMATRFGATETLLADKADVGLLAAAKEVKTRCAGRGADYAFECTAIPALGAAPLAMIRNAGTAVQVSGIEEEITVDMQLFEWDKIYINPLYGGCVPERDFPRLLEHYRTGELLLDEMITRTYPLSELATAFADMLAGRNAKGVIVFP